MSQPLVNIGASPDCESNGCTLLSGPHSVTIADLVGHQAIRRGQSSVISFFDRITDVRNATYKTPAVYQHALTHYTCSALHAEIASCAWDEAVKLGFKLEELIKEDEDSAGSHRTRLLSGLQACLSIAQYSHAVGSKLSQGQQLTNAESATLDVLDNAMLQLVLHGEKGAYAAVNALKACGVTVDEERIDDAITGKLYPSEFRFSHSTSPSLPIVKSDDAEFHLCPGDHPECGSWSSQTRNGFGLDPNFTASQVIPALYETKGMILSDQLCAARPSLNGMSLAQCMNGQLTASDSAPGAIKHTATGGGWSAGLAGLLGVKGYDAASSESRSTA